MDSTMHNPGLLTIDGKNYNVGVVSIQRKAEILDKDSSGRTLDGTMNREIIGTYYNYQIKFTNSQFSNLDDYDALFDVLSSPQSDGFHVISVPYGQNGSHTYEAYFSSVSDEVARIERGTTYWKNLTGNFIAQKPARTPANTQRKG